MSPFGQCGDLLVDRLKRYMVKLQVSQSWDACNFCVNSEKDVGGGRTAQMSKL